MECQYLRLGTRANSYPLTANRCERSEPGVRGLQFWAGCGRLWGIRSACYGQRDDLYGQFLLFAREQ